MAKRQKTVRQALQHVDKNPDWPDDNAQARMDMPVWEYVARNLFDMAVNPDTRVKGQMARATRAQKIILDRLTGTRRVGTRPATKVDRTIEFVDLTKGVIPTAPDLEDEDE